MGPDSPREDQGGGVMGGLWAGGGGAGGCVWWQGAEMELSGGTDPSSRALRAQPPPPVEQASEQGRGRGGGAPARGSPVRGGRWAEGRPLRHTWARALSASLCLTDETWLTPRSGQRSRLHSAPGANSLSQGHTVTAALRAHTAPPSRAARGFQASAPLQGSTLTLDMWLDTCAPELGTPPARPSKTTHSTPRFTDTETRSHRRNGYWRHLASKPGHPPFRVLVHSSGLRAAQARRTQGAGLGPAGHCRTGQAGTGCGSPGV